jgi:hypothetical protein
MVFMKVVGNDVGITQKFESLNLDHSMKSYAQNTKAVSFSTRIGTPYTTFLGGVTLSPPWEHSSSNDKRLRLSRADSKPTTHH